MTWIQASTGPHLRVNWSQPGLPPVDPYLIWLDMVGLDVIGGACLTRDYGDKLPLLMELAAPFSANGIAGVEVPAVYLEPLGRSGQAAKYVSARVAPQNVAALLADKGVLRVQLELAKITSTDSQAPPDPRSQAPAARPLPLAAPAAKGAATPQTWLGVIDVGCAFAHAKYRMPGVVGSRVRYIWDQSLARQPGVQRWRYAGGLGYGAELGPIEIQAAMAALPDEARCYAAVGCEAMLAGRAQHGFGVLDLAAGQPSPLRAGPPPLLGPPPLIGPGDVAGTLPIVFAQLESLEARDTSISSLGVPVLDALRWMIDRVERHSSPGHLQRDPDTRLVVNLSYGGLAGPHDGTSILERAIDELIARRDNLAVVLAAGNSFDEELMTHAELCIAAGRPGRLQWQVQPDDATDNFLELWFPAGLSVASGPGGAKGSAPPAAVSIRVTPPDGSPSPWIVADQTWLLQTAGRTVAGAIFRDQAANGEHSAMLLLALQPTAPRDGSPRRAPAGRWTVEVDTSSRQPLAVHAWIERDDYVAGNLNRRQQSSLVDPRDGTVTPTYGLSSIAYGRYTIVAGGYCQSDGKVARDSASGPARGQGTGSRQVPEVSAPSDESRAVPGLRVAGVTSGVVNRMSGTSAAAPSVTRWIANWFATRQGTVTIAALRRAMAGLARPAPGPVPPERLGSVVIDAMLGPPLP